MWMIEMGTRAKVRAIATTTEDIMVLKAAAAEYKVLKEAEDASKSARSTL